MERKDFNSFEDYMKAKEELGKKMIKDLNPTFEEIKKMEEDGMKKLLDIINKPNTDIKKRDSH
jgi:hypothetical protein